MEENKLNVSSQLHLHGKTWAKLAKHFTAMLADRDTRQLLTLQEHVDRWNDLLQVVDTTMQQREDLLRTELRSLADDMERCYRNRDRPGTRATPAR